MHPPLEAHKHEGCDQVIEALEECHRAGTFNKFIGTCNAAKRAVDQCLKEEVCTTESQHSSGCPDMAL